MSNVTFDEQNLYTPPPHSSESSQSFRVAGIPGILMRAGLAKSENQAKYVMLGISAVCILITIYIAFFHGKGGNPLSPQEKQKQIDDFRKQFQQQ